MAKKRLRLYIIGVNMKGNIYFIKNNLYGFINGDDGKEYYFNRDDYKIVLYIN